MIDQLIDVYIWFGLACFKTAPYLIAACLLFWGVGKIRDMIG